MELKETIQLNIPPRRYLTREEAAGWLGVGVDTFSSLDIPFVDLGPRCKRWDVLDIQTYAEQNKAHNSARTSAQQKGRQTCVSTNTQTHQIGGLIGGIKTDAATVKALGLKTRT